MSAIHCELGPANLTTHPGPYIKSKWYQVRSTVELFGCARGKWCPPGSTANYGGRWDVGWKLVVTATVFLFTEVLWLDFGCSSGLVLLLDPFSSPVFLVIELWGLPQTLLKLLLFAYISQSQFVSIAKVNSIWCTSSNNHATCRTAKTSFDLNKKFQPVFFSALILNNIHMFLQGREDLGASLISLFAFLNSCFKINSFKLEKDEFGLK